jgi:hypothetical protein
MKVIVCYVVSDILKVVTALFVLVFVLAWLELTQCLPSKCILGVFSIISWIFRTDLSCLHQLLNLAWCSRGVRKGCLPFFLMLNVWVGGSQKEAAAALEEEVRVLKVIIFPGPVEASIDSGILISLCTLVHKEFILAACILCGTSI